MALLLCAVADDYTGASDLANTLNRNGLPTIQTIGVPALNDLNTLAVKVWVDANGGDSSIFIADIECEIARLGSYDLSQSCMEGRVIHAQ